MNMVAGKSSKGQTQKVQLAVLQVLLSLYLYLVGRLLSLPIANSRQRAETPLIVEESSGCP